MDQAQRRRALQAQWDARAAGIGAGPLLRAWLDGAPAAMALLKRAAREPDRAGSLLQAADAVLARLPATGMPRSQLAADTLGDAHGLDAGRPVARGLPLKLGDSCGTSSCSSMAGSTRISAFSLLIKPSLNISTEVRTIAWAFILPLRVCRQ